LLPAPLVPYPLSLHDALPIFDAAGERRSRLSLRWSGVPDDFAGFVAHVCGHDCRHRILLGRQWPLATRHWIEWWALLPTRSRRRSEEHTSELQSRFDLVCRLL